MSTLTAGVYTRTSILADRYDRYEKALLFYCKQNGWGNIKYYRDRVGKGIQQDGFDALERSLQKGEVDSDLIGMLVRQETEDESHRWDAFADLIKDAKSGNIDVMVVHDVGQLGKDRLGVLRNVSVMMETGKKLHIYGIGEVSGSTCLFDSTPIDSPDSLGT